MEYEENLRIARRTAVFAAVREILADHAWRSVNLTMVAKAAGLSRQTIYNEFGSRRGLAEQYAIELADQFCDIVDQAVWANVGDPRAGLEAGFGTFLAAAAHDPLVRMVHAGEAHPELLRLVTTDSRAIITHATGRLAATYENSWIRASPEAALRLARVAIRIGMSYIAMPPEADHDVAADLAELFTPYVEAVARAAETQG